MTEERPILQWKPLIALYEEITCENCNPEDPRKARRFFKSLKVLRVINGHPGAFRSEVMAALHSEENKK